MSILETAAAPAETVEDTNLDASSRILRSRRLETLRKMTRLSRQEFARVHSLPYGSLQNWEDPKYGGLTKMGAPRVIAALLKEGIICNESWLLYGEGPAPYVSAAVLLDRMQIKSAGYVSSASLDDKESLNMQDELSLFRHHYQDILDMVVADEGLFPVFAMGDCVAGRRFEGSAIDQCIGKPCIVETRDSDHYLLRKLERATSRPQSGSYNLVCTYENAAVDSKIIENVNVVSVAPVAWVRKRIDY